MKFSCRRNRALLVVSYYYVMDFQSAQFANKYFIWRWPSRIQVDLTKMAHNHEGNNIMCSVHTIHGIAAHFWCVYFALFRVLIPQMFGYDSKSMEYSNEHIKSEMSCLCIQNIFVSLFPSRFNVQHSSATIKRRRKKSSKKEVIWHFFSLCKSLKLDSMLCSVLLRNFLSK